MGIMGNVMTRHVLIHPPGGLPQGAPKGLVDVWMNTHRPLAEQARQVLVENYHAHAFGIMVWGVVFLLLIGFLVWFWRDWRGRVLRWQIRRLQHLLARDPKQAPEPLGAALMWALARYFQMLPALDRRALPPRWRLLVVRLDVLRFGPPATIDDWRVLLREMQEHTRRDTASPAPVRQS